MLTPLHKTTIVIWSPWPPQENNIALSALARSAEIGDSYCSKMESVAVMNPKEDEDWDGTEFFNEGYDD